MRTEIERDTILRALNGLLDNDMRKVWRNALKKSANILVKETKDQLIAKMGTSATHKSLKYGKSLRQGVKASVKKDVSEAKVHIMGDFRLKFFEMGTKERYTRRGNKKRGKIKPFNFFQTAKQSKETEMYNSIEANLVDELYKIYERN